MRPLRLLVLADDPAEAELLASLLRHRGHECTEIASTGAEALALARASPFDLALVDAELRCPRLGDRAGPRAARLLEWGPGVPSLFIAAEPERVRPGYDGLGVLERPVRSGVLTESVRAAMRMLRTGEVPNALPEGLRLWMPPLGPRDLG